MSDWAKQTKGLHSHGFCPGCGMPIFLSGAQAYPELMKCPCGSEWCNIGGKVPSTNKVVVDAEKERSEH